MRLSKKAIVIIVQIILISASAYLIVSKLTQVDFLSQFKLAIQKFKFWHVFLILALSAINWLFDTETWRLIIRPFVKIKFWRAFKINVVAQSAGAITPLSAGDYGLRSYLLKHEIEGWQNVLLSWSYRLIKMAVRVILGLLCVFYIMVSNDLVVIGILLSVGLLILGGISIKHMISWVSNTKGASKVLDKKDRIDFGKLNLKRVIIPGILLFLAYSVQTSLLIFWMNNSVGFYDVLNWVIITYSITSFLPTTGIFDPLIKSAFGALFSAQLVASPAVILFAFTITWLINLGIPGLVSSVLFRKIIAKAYRTSRSTINPS